MTARAAVVLAVLVHAFPALAEFEGVCDLRVTGNEQGAPLDGKGKVYLSPVGWRMELEMTIPDVAAKAKGLAPGAPQVQRVVSFGKLSSPGKSWLLNDRSKTYHVVDRERPEASHEDEDWKITKLGQETVAGFSCTNVRAERKGQDETYEACLAKDFISDAWLKSAREGEEWWVGAARKAGYGGYPVRLVGRAPDGSERHRMEFVKVERRKVPASMFEVPAGYKEGSMVDVMASPEQQKQLQEAQRRMQERMKNLTPEQRKQIEQLMKQYGGGEKQE